jgi:hypothetical protein
MCHKYVLHPLICSNVGYFVVSLVHLNKSDVVGSLLYLALTGVTFDATSHSSRFLYLPRTRTCAGTPTHSHLVAPRSGLTDPLSFNTSVVGSIRSDGF